MNRSAAILPAGTADAPPVEPAGARRRRFWIVAAVLLLGAGLRFYQLGADSFWLDEAGVAYAARAATLGQMLAVVRSHVLAMPLDYLVVWLVGRVSTQALALRIPAALWGTGSLWLAYTLYRRVTRPPAGPGGSAPALFGLLILALAPLHIQYSQELRFYASLVFFYLLVTSLLWDALADPTPRRWGLCLAAALVGIFFHPYVLFAFASGAVWLALRPQNTPAARDLRVKLLLCITVCLLAFLGGYLTFSASNAFVIPLMVFEHSPAAAVATGLGWLPFYPGSPGWPWLWGGLCAGLEIAGVIRALRWGWRSPAAGLFYSLLLQIAAVIGADLLQHYFFAPRQFLMLLPLLTLFAGLGADWAARGLARQAARLRLPAPAAAASLAAAAVLILAALPALGRYWQDDKGSTEALSAVLLGDWQPGDTVLVTPAFNGYVYKYYLEEVYHRMDVSAGLFAAAWPEVAGLPPRPGRVFLITPYALAPAETAQLLHLGYTARFHSAPLSRYAAALWVKGP